jgi:curved DNA-binding protein CbpA
MSGATYKNYYELLEVGRDASTDEIRVAFRRKMAALGGVNGAGLDADDEDDEVAPQSRALVRVITAAYTTLSNVEKRTEYDRLLPPPLATWEESDEISADRHWVAKKIAQRMGAGTGQEPYALGQFGVIQDGATPTSAFDYLPQSRAAGGAPLGGSRWGFFGNLLRMSR